MHESEDPPARLRLLKPGDRVGASYEIKAVLNDSPESTVYLAYHSLLDSEIAIKVLKLSSSHEDKRRLLRFQQEMQLASSLSHAAIVKVYGSGLLESGAPYIAMEYVKGQTLRQWFSTNGRMSLSFFQEIFGQLLLGLECAHQAKLIHRDIKPENLLLAESVEGETTAKITDFGIAQAIDEEGNKLSLTRTAEVSGTPAYMSPEQCEKKPLDQRSDIYSLACVMYEALSEQPPFVSESALDLMYKHVHEPPKPLSSFNLQVPEKLRRLVERCLCKNPDDRVASASSLASMVAAIGATRPLPSGRVGAVIVAILFLAGLPLTIRHCMQSQSRQAVTIRRKA